MSTIPKHPNSVECATSTRLAQSSSGLIGRVEQWRVAGFE
jgi:hypothetical protein